MPALTNAEKQARYRARQREKLKELEKENARLKRENAKLKKEQGK